MKNAMDSEDRICKVCGKLLPIENFSEIKPKNKKTYHIYTCNKCRYQKHVYQKNKLSDSTEIIINIKYKKIIDQRILKIEEDDIKNQIEKDEYFVKMVDYQNFWISDYGKAIHLQKDGRYKLLKPFVHNGSLCYGAMKNIYKDGKWMYKAATVYAAQAVVDTFIVNPDVANNRYIWHKKYNKQDNYYKHLYPLNKEQYRVLKAHFMKTRDDSEEYIIKVINDIKFKPDNWSKKSMQPVMCGIGYWGRDDVDCTSKAYIRWHDMLNRCYNDKFHEKQPQYKGCSVCDEWLNFSNFEYWYNKNNVSQEQMDIDKDILFKGNKIYDPAHVIFVPHCVNTLFLNAKKARGDLPVGVYLESSKNKYRAEINFIGNRVKIGTYDKPKVAFEKYKEYKERLIQKMAEHYKGKIADKAYRAIVKWKIEETD